MLRRQALSFIAADVEPENVDLGDTHDDLAADVDGDADQDMDPDALDTDDEDETFDLHCTTASEEVRRPDRKWYEYRAPAVKILMT